MTDILEKDNHFVIDYNGWKNRSTWLVALHLYNTTQDITDKAHELAKACDTLQEFTNRLKILLLDIPLLEKEKGYIVSEVDFDELWDNFRIT